MRRKLPSNAALIAFETAARHGSFARAANELALTEGAISRQMGRLGSLSGRYAIRARWQPRAAFA